MQRCMSAGTKIKWTFFFQSAKLYSKFVHIYSLTSNKYKFQLLCLLASVVLSDKLWPLLWVEMVYLCSFYLLLSDD